MSRALRQEGQERPGAASWSLAGGVRPCRRLGLSAFRWCRVLGLRRFSDAASWAGGVRPCRRLGLRPQAARVPHSAYPAAVAGGEEEVSPMSLPET